MATQAYSPTPGVPVARGRKPRKPTTKDRKNPWSTRVVSIANTLLAQESLGAVHIGFHDKPFGILSPRGWIVAIKFHPDRMSSVFDALNAALQASASKPGGLAENVTQFFRDVAVVPRAPTSCKSSKKNYRWQTPADGMWEFSETAWKRRQKRREKQTNNKKGPRAASLGQGSVETESSAASTVMSPSSPCPEATIMPPIVLGLPVFPYPEQPDNIIHHPLSCVFPKQPPSSSFPMTSSPSACPSISHPAATTGHKSGDLAYAPTEVQTHAPASQNSTDAQTRNVSSSAQKADSEIWAHHTFKLENLSLSELEQHPFQTQPLHHHPTCEFPSHPASSAAHPEIPIKPKVAPAEGRHPSVSLQHHPAQVHVPCQPNPAAAFAECEARSASQHPISNPSAESRQLRQVLPGACAGLGADQTEAKVAGGGVRPRGRRAAGGKQEKGRAAKSVSTELSMPEVAAALLEAVEASAELQKRADVLRGPSKPAPSSRAGAQKKLKGSAAAPPSPSLSNALAEGVRSGPAEEVQVGAGSSSQRAAATSAHPRATRRWPGRV